MIAGFDIGAQQKAMESSDYNVWYTPVSVARFVLSDRLILAARAEYDSDANGVIIAAGSGNVSNLWLFAQF